MLKQNMYEINKQMSVKCSYTLVCNNLQTKCLVVNRSVKICGFISAKPMTRAFRSVICLFRIQFPVPQCKILLTFMKKNRRSRPKNQTRPTIYNYRCK